MTRNEPDRQYCGEPLGRRGVGDDPIALFAQWFQEAIRTNRGPEYLPEVVALATASADAEPSVRMVLLKGFDAEGCLFFTNYRSRKARDLSANPRASMVLYWPWLHRQVRLSGHVVLASSAESDAYFATRPRPSRLGAWASAQSEPLDDEQTLQRRMAEFDARFADRDVPRPQQWGGYRLVPEEMEFWQGRPDRLHDRWLFRRAAAGWQVRRLAP